VTENTEAEWLATTQQFAVVLGVVVDKVGRVLYGEIVDPQLRGRYRFVGLDGIPTAVHDWLGEVLSDQSRDES
jgi:hypothetical protein